MERKEKEEGLMELTEDFGTQVLELDESTPRSPHVLARIKGPFFFADTPSRNGRIYPKALWERVLSSEDTQRKLQERLMFGTVGHADMDFDTLIREQKVSHVVTSLRLDPRTGTGIGEADILDTPVGRVLYTLLKSGSRISVSTKGLGQYKGKDENGNQVVDPDTYQLLRIDCVCDPGFLQARPELQEAYGEEGSSVHDDNKKEVWEEMNDKNVKTDESQQQLIERLLNEKLALERQVEELLGQVHSARAQGKVEELTRECQSLKEQLQEAQRRLHQYEALGTVEQVEEALRGAKTLLSQYSELGPVEELQERLQLLSQYEALGAVEEVEKALKESKALLERYTSLGTVEEVEEALHLALDFVRAVKEAEVEEAVEELSARFGVGEDKVQDLLNRMSVEEAESLLQDLTAASSSTTSSTTNSRNQNGGSGSGDSGMEERFSRVNRLYESFK